MRLPGYFIAFALTVLLAATTPVGTGAGAHQMDLLHPLFAHVHLLNGHVVTHEELARAVPSPAARSTPGPAFGSASAGAGPDGGLGISPIGLSSLAGIVLENRRGSWLVDLVHVPTGREE